MSTYAWQPPLRLADSSQCASDGGGSRSFSTAIFFLVPRGHVSRLHRIASSEVWHFYSGEPLTVVELQPATGVVTRTVLGSDVLGGQKLQHVVPAGCWFGSHLTRNDDDVGDVGDAAGYALVGCTVAPGFDFRDFELATREDMLHRFPHAEADVLRLT